MTYCFTAEVLTFLINSKAGSIDTDFVYRYTGSININPKYWTASPHSIKILLYISSSR